MHFSFLDSILYIQDVEVSLVIYFEIKDENHILHSRSPKREITYMAVRNSYPYKIPITKVPRYGRGFIPYCKKNGKKILNIYEAGQYFFMIILFYSYLLTPCSIIALLFFKDNFHYSYKLIQ